MKFQRYEHGVIEVAEALHGAHIGTRDGLSPEQLTHFREWLKWRIQDGWEPSTTKRDMDYDMSVRTLAFVALRLVSP